MKFNHLFSRFARDSAKTRGSSSSIQAASCVAPTLLKPKRFRWIRPLSLRRSTVLSGIKVTAVVVAKVGAATPVPMIQPISEGVKKMIEYCEVCKIILSGDRVGPVTSLSLRDE